MVMSDVRNIKSVAKLFFFFVVLVGIVVKFFSSVLFSVATNFVLISFVFK